jgi:hypothetical protein
LANLLFIVSGRRLGRHEQLLQEGPAAWQQMEGAPALTDLGIVHAPPLNSAVTETLERQQMSKVTHIWDVLNLEAWLRPRL